MTTQVMILLDLKCAGRTWWERYDKDNDDKGDHDKHGDDDEYDKDDDNKGDDIVGPQARWTFDVSDSLQKEEEQEPQLSLTRGFLS